MEERSISKVISSFPFKKTWSVLLAVIMMLSSVTVIGSAVEATKEQTEATEMEQTEEKLTEEEQTVEEQPGEDAAGEEAQQAQSMKELLKNHYEIEAEGEKISFRFDEDGSVIADDAMQAQTFFDALGSKASLGAGAKAEDFEFDDRYLTIDPGTAVPYICALFNEIIGKDGKSVITDRYSGFQMHGISDWIDNGWIDNDHNYRCDFCKSETMGDGVDGRCLLGCTDGDMIIYTEETAPEGVEAKEATITTTDADGNEKTETILYYDPVYQNQDGFCDVCGFPMCSSLDKDGAHLYNDGRCDICGLCVEGHIDADDDKACDVCGVCFGDHADINGDEECDQCGYSTKPCTHEDTNDDGICDLCDFCVISQHFDGESDDICDRCGICVSGNHTDALSDNKCDLCGICVETDEESGVVERACADENSDGKCDTCGKFITGCGHLDDDGDGVCDICESCFSGKHTDEDHDGFCDICRKKTCYCADHTSETHDNCEVCGQPYCAGKTKKELQLQLSYFQKLMDACSSFSDHYASIIATGSYTDEQELICTALSTTTALTAVYGDKVKTLVTTYDQLPSVQGELELIKQNIDKNLPILKKFTAMTDAELQEAATNGTYYSFVKAWETVMASGLEKCKDVSEHYGDYKDYNNNPYTSYIAGYYGDFYQKNHFLGFENQTSYNSFITNAKSTAQKLLKLQLDEVYGADYQKGNIVTLDNRLSLRRKAGNVSKDLFYLLYGQGEDQNSMFKAEAKGFIADNNDISSEIETLAEKIWQGKTTVSGSCGSLNHQLIVKYSMLSQLRTEVANLISSTFLLYEEKKKELNDIPNVTKDGVDYYAVREIMDNDLAREIGDEYYITKDIYNPDGSLAQAGSLTQMVREIDDFLTSRQFLDLLGIKEGDTLYDYVEDMINGLFKDGSMNGVVSGLLSTIYPMLCGLVDNGLHDFLAKFLNDNFFSVEEFTKNNITVWGMDFFNFLFSKLTGQSWAGGLITLIAISFSSFVYIAIDGAYGTKTFKEVLSTLGISIYPKDVAAQISAADTQGKFENITKELGKADTWTDVDFDKLDWKVNDLDSLIYAVSALLAPFGEIQELVFSSQKTLHKEIDNLAGATFEIFLLHIYPVGGSFTVNVEIETSPLNIYGQVIVPLLEALGINNNAPDPSLSYEIENIGGGTAYGSSYESLQIVVKALFKFIEQVAANPIEKLLSILPNLMFYIQNGFIPELMDISFSIKQLQLTLDVDAKFIISFIAQTFLAIVVPALAFAWIPFIGGGLLIAAEVLQGLVVAGWDAFMIYMAAEGFNLADMINGAFNVGSILSDVVSVESLGFDVGDIKKILEYVIGKDSPLMDIINVINFDEIGYLGTLEKRSGSARDERTSKRYKVVITPLLGGGEYYFINANIGDVFWFLIDTVTDILHDEKAFKAILDLTGLKIEEVQQIIDNLHLEQYGLEISVGDTIKGLDAEDLIFLLQELILPSDKYDLKQVEWAEADPQTMSEVASHDDKIPYLEYDNIWTQELSNELSEGVDGLIGILGESLDLQSKLGIEDASSPEAIVNSLIKKYVDPSMITAVTKKLSDLGGSLGATASTIKDLMQIDLTQWNHDFAYLFGDADEPETPLLPLLSGEKQGDDIVWTYNGEEVTDFDDIVNAFGYLLTPVEKVLDYLLAGKDLGVMYYDSTKTASVKHLVTLKGSQSYNYAFIPLLEALGIEADIIPDQAEFDAMGSGAGVAKMVSLIVSRLKEIAGSPGLLEKLMEMLVQLIYLFSSGGVDVLISDILHPIFVLIDIIRPVLDIDVNNVLNTLLCKYTYSIGGYENEEDMRKVLKEQNAEIMINDLTADKLFRLASVIISAMADDDTKRLFFNILDVFNAANKDLSCLREEYRSKSVDKSNQHMTAYRINTDDGDSLTIMLSFLLEVIMKGDNPKIIDGLIGLPGLVETVADFLWGIEIEYSLDYNWAYILGDKATQADKEQLLARIKENALTVNESSRTEQAQKDFDKYLATYTDTRWDQGTAEYLEDYLTDMLETVLNVVTDEETGERLGDTLFSGTNYPKNTDITLEMILNTLVEGYLTDEIVDKIVYLVSNLLTGDTLAQYKDIIYCLDGILGVDVSVYSAVRSERKGDKVIYYDAEDHPCLTRRAVNSKDDFAGAIADILKPLAKIFSWLLLGDDARFFNTTGVLGSREINKLLVNKEIITVESTKERRDDLICVKGSEGYKYGLMPLLEAIGCKDLGAADSYEKDGEYDTDKFLEDLLGSIVSRVLEIIDSGDGASAIDNLVSMLPNLFYYINSNGLSVSVNNVIATVNYALMVYSERSGKDVTLSTLLGFPLDDLTFNGIFDIVEGIKFDAADGSDNKYSLKFNTFVRRLLTNFTIGEISYNKDSNCAFDTYRMEFTDSSQRAQMLVILISAVFDIIEDPDNKNALSSILSPEIMDAVTNIYNMKEFRFAMQDFTWLFTEHAGSNVLINALEMSDLFKGEEVYGKLYTRKMAAELADNLEQFIADMLYLIGLEIDGIPIRDFKSLIHILLGNYVFNQDTIDSITGALGEIKSLLDTYDPDGYIAGFINELLDIDLHSWDDYAPGGKYEKGRDWGFATEITDEKTVDKNLQVFEGALIELLKPIAPLITWLMCDEEFTLFVEGDGLGNADNVQFTIYGAEAYAYAFVPLLEALNVDGSPKDLTKNLRKNNILSPADYTAKAREDNEYAAYGIIHPLMAKVDAVMDSTIPEILELLPSLVYFINCNGLDTLVKNLIHAGLVVLNAIEPIGKQIETFVYDEQGINIYKTIDFEGLIKDSLYGALGVTEKDMAQLYRSMGDEYKTVDGLEDVDFKWVFALLVAKLNGLMKDLGLEFKFTTIAGDAIRELTCGYVRGFTSLNGRQAYTMILSKDIDSQCYGDLITILIRLILKFLSTDNNAEALMHLIQATVKMNAVGYELLDTLLKLLVKYIASPNNAQIAMASVYYTVYGLSVGSGTGVTAYDDVNAKWTQVIGKLENVNNPIASEILKTIISIADVKAEGVIDSNGIAANGFFGFFKKIIEWFKWLINFIKNLFK